MVDIYNELKETNKNVPILKQLYTKIYDHITNYTTFMQSELKTKEDGQKLLDYANILINSRIKVPYNDCFVKQVHALQIALENI